MSTIEGRARSEGRTTPAGRPDGAGRRHGRAVIAPSVQGWVLPHLITWVESRGPNASPIRRLFGRTRLVDPNVRVPEAVTEKAWRLAATLTCDEALGIHLAESLPRGALDFIGYALRIAQNGIQFGNGASGSAVKNTVTGHAYTGVNTAASGGILVVGGACYSQPLTTGIQIAQNILTNNDVGVYLSNLDDDCLAPADQTNVKVVNNTISNDRFTNNYPYQAGVSDMGNNDKILNNTISGPDIRRYPGTAYRRRS